MYSLVNESDVPILVKYDEGISYFPVFQSEENALSALKNLSGSTSSSILRSETEYFPKCFSWAMFQEWKSKLDEHGTMLFLFPMSPSDYGDE